MSRVEHILYSKLADPKTPLSSKELQIEYLRSLKREGHPEWFCISKMHEHIKKLLEHHLQRLISGTEIVSPCACASCILSLTPKTGSLQPAPPRGAAGPSCATSFVWVRSHTA